MAGLTTNGKINKQSTAPKENFLLFSQMFLYAEGGKIRTGNKALPHLQVFSSEHLLNLQETEQIQPLVCFPSDNLFLMNTFTVGFLKLNIYTEMTPRLR